MQTGIRDRLRNIMNLDKKNLRLIGFGPVPGIPEGSFRSIV